MSFEITGKLHKKFDTENKTDSFQAREFVIVTENGSYSQYIKFQLVQDRCSLVDDYNEVDMVKVHFDLRGREWNGKYFTNLNAWRVETGAAAEASASAPATAAAPASPATNNFPTADDSPSMDADDDLPF